MVQSRILKASRMLMTPEGEGWKMSMVPRVSMMLMVMSFEFLITERPTALSGKRLDLNPPRFIFACFLSSPRGRRREKWQVVSEGVGLGAGVMSEVPLPLPHRYCR